LIDETCRIPFSVQTLKNNITMEIPAGEVEFRTNYSLLELGGQTLASPFAAVASPGFAAIEKVKADMDAHLKKLDGYCKCCSSVN